MTDAPAPRPGPEDEGPFPGIEERIRDLLVRRVRIAGIITLPFIALYSLADHLLRPGLAPTLLGLKTITFTACLVAIAAPSVPSLRRQIVPAGAACTIAVGLTGCLSAVVEQDVSSLPILITSLGLTSAVYLPWGVFPQAMAAGTLFLLTVASMIVVLGPGGMAGSAGVGSLLGMVIVLGNSPIVALTIRRLIVRTAESRYARRQLSLDLRQRLEEANRKLERRGIALEQALEEAEKANLSKSRFLASISHELRTPLTSILGFAGMLRNGAAGPVSPKQLDYASEIGRSAEHLLRLVEGILSHARIEANEDPLQLSDVPIDLLVEVACRQVTPAALERKLQIRRSLPSGSRIVADRQKLLQVMLNLLSNAIKFTPEGREIGTEIHDRGATIEIVVWDQGVGLGVEDLERVFRPFEQVAEANRTSQKGAGLGLAICRRLIELHGGTLRAESAAGSGSRFIVSLPKESMRFSASSAAVRTLSS